MIDVLTYLLGFVFQAKIVQFILDILGLGTL